MAFFENWALPTRAAVFDRCQRPNFAPQVCLVDGDDPDDTQMENFSTSHIQTAEASRRTPAPQGWSSTFFDFAPVPPPAAARKKPLDEIPGAFTML